MEDEAKKFYNEDISHILERLKTDLNSGLSQERAQIIRDELGPNILEEKKRPGILSRIISQFADFLVLVLIAAAGISYLLGNVKDALIILSIVIVNALLGVYQEGRAEKSLEALKKMSSSTAKVLRDGSLKIINARDLVVGDIVSLDAGDIVAADLRLFESSNLKLEESSLTGESLAVEKNAQLILEEDADLGDRVNMAYMGTIVTYGRGQGLVVATGHDTEIGKIASLIQSYDDQLTPLQKQLNSLGKSLGLITILVCILVFGLGFIQGQDPMQMFMTAISLAVAAIPEGLPAIVTIVLAIGMNRMVKKNAIVKKLLAVETLGSTTVICSDKTGTLTENEMTVVKIYTDEKILDVTGTGYTPVGDILYKNRPVSIDDIGDLETILAASALTNDASLEAGDDGYKVIGDPTEGALISLAGKCDFNKKLMNENYPRLADLPFDSDRKMMTSFHQGYLPDGLIAFTKGAPDIVIERSNRISQAGRILEFSPELKEKVLRVNREFSSQALRVLAIAYRDYEEMPKNISSQENEDQLIFVGLLAMIDPPRAQAKEAIKNCRLAGIKTIMITGDYKETAFAIAKELGMADDISQAVMGKDLDGLDEEQLRQLVKNTSVYSRVSPEHKVKIIQALKDNGEVVSMTGDGVNDALALKKSDIGVAMGITGTDVAKNTADLILMDDNFSTIVAAVEEGRIIYSNIRKFVSFLLSCNIGEVILVLSSIVLGMPIPLLPIQLLWLNLVTDSFPALALGVEKGEPDIMKKRPRDPKEPILTRKLLIRIVIQSIALAGASLYAFNYGLEKYPNSLDKARTIIFTSLILAELLRAYSSRSENYSVFKIGFFSNRQMLRSTGFSLILLLAVLYIPALRPIFNTFALGLDDWKMVILMALIPFAVGEASKLFIRS